MKTDRRTLIIICVFVQAMASVSNGFSSSEATLERYNMEMQDPLNHHFRVKSEHPRVMIEGDKIEKIERWIKGKKVRYHGTLYDLLLKKKEYAFLSALTSKGSNKLAVERLLAGLSKEFNSSFSNKQHKPSSLDWYALRYDWAYHALTEDERRKIVSLIVPNIKYKRFVFDRAAFYNGYREGSGSAPGIITGLAFYESLSPEQRRAFHRYVSDFLSDLRAMNHRSGNSGGWGISLLYGNNHATDASRTLFALETATEDGGFLERFGSSFINFGFAYAQLMLPSNSWARYGDCAGHSFFVPMCMWPRAAALRLGADYLRNKGQKDRALLTIWALENACGTNPKDRRRIKTPTRPEDILMFSDPGFRVESLRKLNLPLACALGWDEDKGEIERYDGKKAGIGVVVMRSAWEDPMATHATFRSMPFLYPIHYGAGELTFGITKGEELALAYTGKYYPHFEGGPWHTKGPGWPHYGHYFTRAMSTNSLLIYDPKEDFGGWNNGGGQREWKGVPEIRHYGCCRNGNPLDSGGLTGFEQHEDYVFASADATRAYSSILPMSCGPRNKPKVSLVQRDFVYLRSHDGWEDYFVVFDRVMSVNPHFKKVWLLHTQARPEVDGSSTMTVGKESAGIFRSHDSSVITMTQDKARLFSRTLLPRKGDFLVRYLGGQMETKLVKPLDLEGVSNSNEKPIDIEVESTEGFPRRPVVIIHQDPPRYSAGDTLDSYSRRPWPEIPLTRVYGNRPWKGIKTTRDCFFCEGKTPPGMQPAKLLKCRRVTKSARANAHPAGAKVIQGFRYMGMEGTDLDDDSARIDYPHAYGEAYDQFNSWDGLLYGMWRVEVQSTRTEKVTNFLHVLHPSRPDGKMPPCVLVESKGDTAVGALVDNRLVLFGKEPAAGWREDPDKITPMKPLKEATYELDFRGELSQLLVSLKPGTRYRIEQNGDTIFDGLSSQQGIINFKSQSSGRSRFDLTISQ